MLNCLNPLLKTSIACKNFLSAAIKQWADAVKKLDSSESQCRRCGSCKHLCSYMKPALKGDRDVQIS